MAKKKPHTTKEFGDLDYWISQWLSYKGPRQSEATHKAYRLDLDQFLREIAKPFEQVARVDIISYLDGLQMRGELQKTSIARKLATIRSFYRFLNAREITRINLDGIERPKVRQDVDHANQLTVPEVQALIRAAAPDPPLQLLVRFLYLTGCRIAEALSLTWGDLLPLEDGDGEAHIQGKGDKARDAYIRPSLWPDLIGSRGEAAEDASVFPFNYHKAYRAILRLVKAARVDDGTEDGRPIKKEVTPHSLRHAFISHAAAKGVTVVNLRDAAGHANISTTSRYLHGDNTRAAAQALTDDVK